MHEYSAPSWRLRLGLLAWPLLVSATASAQPAALNERAAKKFVADYVQAWNAGDAKTLGGMWTDDGELIDAQGDEVDRKALLANRLARAEGARPKLSIDLEKVRFVDPNVALVDGVSKLTTPQGSAIQQTRFSGVLLRRDGAWKIRMIRQLATRLSAQSPPEEPLKELAWMVGEWVAVGIGLNAHVQTQWDLDNRFLVSQFEYDPESGDSYQAEIRVGWDAETRAVKSWYFDSRGVISTTVWQKSDDHWLGSITGTQSDGQNFTGTMAITQIDNDTYLRTLTNLQGAAGTLLDQELRMFRVPAQPTE